MQEAQNNKDFLGIMNHILEHKKKIEDIMGDKDLMQTQIVALEEQTRVKRVSLIRTASRSRTRSHRSTTSRASMGS